MHKRLLAILLPLFGLTACGIGKVYESTNSASETSSLHVSEPPNAMHALDDWQTFPLDKILFRTIPQRRVFYYAKQYLVRQCMNRHSLKYPINRFLAIPMPDRRYGVTNLTIARNHGYDIPTTFADGPNFVSAREKYLRSLSADQRVAWKRTLHGAEQPSKSRQDGDRPKNGCLMEAEATLYEGQHLRYRELLFRLQNMRVQARRMAEQDPRVQTALSAWSSCMKGHGFQVDSLSRISEFAERATSPSNAVAMRDVKCKQEVGLVSILAREEAKQQRKLMRNHSAIIEEWSRVKRRALAKAGQLGTRYR